MTILCYHSVDPAWDSPMAVRPEEFEAHCRWLERHRTVVPLSQAVSRLDPSGRLPRGVVVMTFDDGFAQVMEYALPVLRRHGLPATVFLVAATLSEEGLAPHWVRTPPPWPLTTLTRDQVLQMQSMGVEFQSHSWAHRDLVDLDDEACVEDLRQSRRILEDLLRHEVRHLAYPRGLHNVQVRRAAAQAGYSYAYSLPESRESAGPFAVPRVGIHRGNGTRILAAKCASHYLGVRNGLARSAARRVRRVARLSG